MHLQNCLQRYLSKMILPTSTPALSLLTALSLTAGLLAAIPSVGRAASEAESIEPGVNALDLSSSEPLAADEPGLNSDQQLIAQFAVPPLPVTVGDRRSLSATGTGSAIVPASRALLQLYFYTIAPIEYDPTVLPQPLQPRDLQSVVNALTASGIPAGDIRVFADPNSTGSGRVEISIEQPTSDRLTEIVTTASSAAIEEGRFSPGGTNVIYSIDNCVEAESQARQEAVANAQERAAALAAAANVELGEILSLSDYSTWGYNYSTLCPSSENVTIPPAYTFSYPLDPTFPPQVTVTTQVAITYEIE